MIWAVVGVVQPGPQQFDLMNSGSPSLLWPLSTTYWSLIIGYKSLYLRYLRCSRLWSVKDHSSLKVISGSHSLLWRMVTTLWSLIIVYVPITVWCLGCRSCCGSGPQYSDVRLLVATVVMIHGHNTLRYHYCCSCVRKCLKGQFLWYWVHRSL